MSAAGGLHAALVDLTTREPICRNAYCYFELNELIEKSLDRLRDTDDDFIARGLRYRREKIQVRSSFAKSAPLTSPFLDTPSL